MSEKIKPIADDAAGEFADRITAVIYDIGDGRIGTRIAVKSGTYPDKERDEGGFCREAFREYVKGVLTGLITP